MLTRIVTGGPISYYYPLREDPPLLELNRFAFDRLEEILGSHFVDLPSGSQEFLYYLRTIWIRNRGFFVHDPMNPHFDLDLNRISRYLHVARTLGVLDSLAEDVPHFFPADAAHWILRHVFSNCHSNPFKKRSLYRNVTYPTDEIDQIFSQLREHNYWSRGISETISCADVSSSLSMLQLLGHLHELRSVCDPRVLAARILELQTEDGFFSPVPPRRQAARYDRNLTTLQAVVALSILDQYFDTGAVASIRAAPLLQYLSNVAKEILYETNISPRDLFTIFDICSSAEAISKGIKCGSVMKKAPAPLGWFEELDIAVMRSLGLARVWEEYKARSEPVESFWAGLKFSESLPQDGSLTLKHLVRDFPAEEIREASWFGLFPAFAVLSLV